MSPKFTKAIFEFTVGIKTFSIHWEREDNHGRYLANVFRGGGGYHISYSVNVSPNQSMSLMVLKRFLKENPQFDIKKAQNEQ